MWMPRRSHQTASLLRPYSACAEANGTALSVRMRCGNQIRVVNDRRRHRVEVARPSFLLARVSLEAGTFRPGLANRVLQCVVGQLCEVRRGTLEIAVLHGP